MSVSTDPSSAHSGPAQGARGAAARDAAEAAAARARDHLLSLQSPAGWWKGELETNVTMEAEDLLLRRFLGILTDDQAAATARWIRSKQGGDGAWASFYGGPADLSTTVEAYVALKLAGDDPDAPHLRSALAYIRANGGLARARVFTRIWMALFGVWPWADLPVMPPEMVLLPKWFPLNVYDFACWARQTVVPLTIVGTLRPVRPLGVDVGEIVVDVPPRPKPKPLSWENAFGQLNRALGAYHRHPLRALRRLAMRRGAEWIVARQEADGCWGGIQPPWVYSIMALHLLGYPLEHPVITAGLAGLERFTITEESADGPLRRLEACQSPVWDTALAVVALADAGVPGDHPALARAASWLLAEEVTVAGDWAVRNADLPPGGWAFEFDNDLYPDTDDTAEVVIALERVTRTSTDPLLARAVDDAVARGVRWTAGMRSRDGGWAAFDIDNTRTLPTKLPFCDFGEVIDPPSADVTAHVVEMFAEVGRAGDPLARRGVEWLLAHQEPGGSWFGRWGVNHVYGTGAVVPALVAAGVPAEHRAIRRAVAWLREHQTPEGGWGEDLRSYVDPAWIGRGAAPTASQTAWALLALLAAGERDSDAVARGVAWLAATQRPDGTWDEPYFTGTGFPWDFSLNYHLYRLVFPLTALGRYLTGAS
jgi:squalene-hopene/tetraprenyl-beta-curcumene cyclase